MSPGVADIQTGPRCIRYSKCSEVWKIFQVFQLEQIFKKFPEVADISGVSRHIRHHGNRFPGMEGAALLQVFHR